MWKLLCVTLSLLMCVRESLSHLEEFPFLNPRIVGGKVTNVKLWPWMVSLNYDSGEHFCGGSLITKEWVLSAAHCVFGEEKSNLRVHLGRTRQKGKEANAIIKKVKGIIIHDNYDNKTDDNDIALLQLSTAVEFTDHIKTVSLADKKSVFAAKTESWIIGWGLIGENKTLPSPGSLRRVTIEVFDNKDCKKRCGGITDNMICAGTKKGGKGPYKGDSGGPMMSKLCSDWVQSGITSWSIGCARPNLPGVFTRVSRYQKWITDRVGKKVKFVHYPQGKRPFSCLG